MSKFLSAVARQEFDSQVKHAYQQAGKLKMCVTNRDGVVGDIYKFRRMGKGLANQKASQADVTPMDVSHALINCILENWLAPEYTDIFDQAEVNFDEQSELASTIANAMGRRQDQLVIDAMGNIPAEAGTALADIAVGAAGMTVDKIRQAGAAFDGTGMGMEGRYIAWNKTQKQQLLGSTEATSSDFMNVKALVNGDIDSFYGFRFVLIEDRDEGGLPGGGSASATSFAFHRDAVGLATGIDIKTEVNYIAEKTSWLCNGLLKAGSIVRDAEGVIKILTNDTL
jgi:hypothetical protein